MAVIVWCPQIVECQCPLLTLVNFSTELLLSDKSNVILAAEHIVDTLYGEEMTRFEERALLVAEYVLKKKRNPPSDDQVAQFVRAVYAKEGMTIQEISDFLGFNGGYFLLNKRIKQYLPEAKELVEMRKVGRLNRYYRTEKGQGMSPNEAKQYILGRTPKRAS